MKVKSLSRVRLFATPWTVAHQAPPSMGFSKQEITRETQTYLELNDHGNRICQNLWDAAKSVFRQKGIVLND